MMRARYSVLHTGFFAIVLAMASPVAGASSGEARHERCMDESGGMTAAMLDCLLEATDHVEAELRGSLDDLRRELEQGQLEALIKSQAAWEAFRQSTCEFEAGLSGGGSFASVAFADCWLAVTRQRLNWSTRLAANQP